MEDFLLKEINLIKDACDKASKIIYMGAFIKNPDTKIVWKDVFSEDGNFDGFLNAFIKSSAKMLVINPEVNKIDIGLSLDEFIANEKQFSDEEDEDDEEERIKMYKNVQNSKGFVVYYKLMFFENGFCFQFQRSVDWVRDYLDMKDIFNDNLILPKSDDNDYRPISEDLIALIANKIIHIETYLNSKTITERRGIATDIAIKENIEHWFDQKLIADRAEAIFISEIKPKQEAELKVKIKALKDKGYTKVKIRGELGITQSILDKLYY